MKEGRERERERERERMFCIEKQLNWQTLHCQVQGQNEYFLSLFLLRYVCLRFSLALFKTLPLFFVFVCLFPSHFLSLKSRTIPFNIHDKMIINISPSLSLPLFDFYLDSILMFVYNSKKKHYSKICLFIFCSV